MVMRVAMITVLALFTLEPAWCQHDSLSIVHFDELSYNSYFEELAFLDFEKGNQDYLRLLMAVDPSVNTTKYEITRREIELELQQVRVRKFQKAKPEKKIELLYESVNANILKRYKEKVLFPDIFNRGEFNCLTATAYYGLLLDSLKIPYEFRETYNHVHPVAYPGQSQINIETTDPFSGVNYFDEKLKLKFVNYLLDTKRVSRETYDTTNVDQLFNLYYLPEKNIGLAEITGLQYMNDALFHYGSEQYAEAFEQIKKAYFLYPSSKVLAVFQFILNGTIYESDFKQMLDARFIVYLSRLIRQKVVSSETVANSFNYMSNLVLVNRSDKQLYDSIFNFLMSNLQQPELRETIEFQYSLLRGKSLLSEYKLKEALKMFQRAYQLNPENLEVQSLFVNTFAYTFQNSSNKEVVSRIEDISARFPSLEKNGLFISLKMVAYLSYVEELFDFDEQESAMKYLTKFEAIYKENPGLEINYKLVGDAYSAAAVYFFKHYNKSRAKEYLEKGLKIAPDNYELLYRLNSL